MRRRATIIGTSLTLALSTGYLPPAIGSPSSAHASAVRTIAAPPKPGELVEATNAMLRPSESTGTLADPANPAGSFETGFINPPGGQDPLPVCVYGPDFVNVSIPLSGAIGYRSESRSVLQDVYQYASTSTAKRAWASLSALIPSKCNGSHNLGDGFTTTLEFARVDGVIGGPKGWGVLASDTRSHYSVVLLVGDAIQMVTLLRERGPVSAKAIKATDALATTLATRWTARATAPLTQNAVLTRAETAMLTPADVPAALPIASPASGAWSDFNASTPGSSPDTCNERVELPSARQSFENELGGTGELFSKQGTLRHSVHVYADAAAARKAWRAVRSAVLACNQAKLPAISATEHVDRTSSGTSGLEIQAVPGVWTRSVQTYPVQPGSTCTTSTGAEVKCTASMTKSYTITLLVGNSIQSLTYGKVRDGVGNVKLDQLAVNVLAEQLAQRWTPEPSSVDSAETRKILATLAGIGQIPRCSKDEGRISAWLMQWAAQHKFPAVADAHKNVIVNVPGSAGRVNQPPVALQAHMDMVCAKTSESTHDFATQPIEWVRDGDWLHANKTTLGADDGIGVAIAMYLATEPGIDRPPLELVFTTDEEIDMSGAAGLAPDAIKAKRYINIDWETEGSLALGSAGGIKRDVTLPMTFSALDGGWDTYRLEITGLRGGHSGLSAGKGHANANVLLAQELQAVGPFRLAAFEGGTADNAFAPSATAVFAVPHDNSAAMPGALNQVEQSIRAKYPDEKGLNVSLTSVTDPPSAFSSPADSKTLVGLLLDIPQDVYEWSTILPGLPETSNNIGVVHTADSSVIIKTFHRSFNPTKLEAFTQVVQDAATRAGATTVRRSAFPTWPPVPESALYKASLAAYEKAFGTKLATVIVHAGLECGFIAEKYPGIDIVSVGPTLIDVHTPDERLYVPSVDRVLTFIRQILKDI